MANETEYEGGCLCGAVRVVARLANTSVGACHCSMCRRWGGGPLMAVECGASVQFDGRDQITVYASSAWAERGFCSRCGSHLFYRLKEQEHYAIPVGLFDNSEPWTFEHQVFIDDKPSFYAFSNETENLTREQVFARFGAPAE